MLDDFRTLFKKQPQGQDLRDRFELGNSDSLSGALRKKTHIISVVNQKGGCGKTTTAINLAAGLAKHGQRVLLIDLDPQCHASLGIGIESHSLTHSVYDVLARNLDLDQVILPTYLDNLDIAPATTLLTGAQLEVADLLGREGLLRTSVYKMLHTRRGRSYDYILIDCSPSLNLITINGLATSQHILIPIQAHYFSLEGMKELFSTVRLVKDRINPELQVLGILTTIFDTRAKMCRRVASQLKDYFEEKVFDTVIRINMALVEATAHGKAIFDFAPGSKGTKDYEELTKEVMEAIQMAAQPGRYGVSPGDMSLTEAAVSRDLGVL